MTQEVHTIKEEETKKPEEPVDETVLLTLADIQYCQKMIEIGTSRGTWKSEELQAVGFVYNKISQWLEKTNLHQQKLKRRLTLKEKQNDKTRRKNW